MKKFFEGKKRELKFKLAGPGHKLSEDGTTAESSNANNPSSASFNAALQRHAKQQSDINLPSSSQLPGGSKPFARDLEKQQKETVCSIGNEVILFRCDTFGNEVYPLNVWKEKFKSYISDIKSTDPVYASILAIKSLNNDQQAQACVKILGKYVQNLIDHPDVERFKQIRRGNSNVQKILAVEGAMDFLHAIGFENQLIVNENDQKEEYLVHCSKDEVDLNEILKSLAAVDGFILSLNRNIQIILPNEKSLINDDLPDEFFEWSVNDFKKEHKSRQSVLEKSQLLRTQKMKEKDDKVKPKLATDYTLIRVRLPDGLVVQVTFSTSEKLKDLRIILDEKIEFFDEFIFVSLPAKVYSEIDENKSFLELDLYPAVILMVKWADSQSEQAKYILRQNT